MKRTYFGTAIIHYLGKHSLTQTEISNRTSLRQSSISDLISKRKRPEVDTLRALCCCWPNAETNIRILIAHLQDEVARAGHNPETDIEMRPINPHSLPRTQACEDLAYLEAHIEHDGVSDAIRMIADLIRRAQGAVKKHAVAPADRAAEAPGADYRTK